jgi:monofunctional biosynthetic peptidoglycan transglycosylase
MRSRLRTSVVVVAAIIAVLVLAPYLIAPLYRVVDPVSMPMLWRFATGARVERTVVPLARIAPALPLAVIVAEDGSFCTNHGIDLGAMRDAWQQADDSTSRTSTARRRGWFGALRGASTLTQQTAKNLFLWQGHSFVRKALEIPLALWLDVVLPKRRVLEIYLNIAEWGPNGEFGAEAAARYAFGKSAHDLNPREAAELAAVLPNPVRRTARTPDVMVRRLAGLYERRAAALAARAACVRGP